jgi:GTP-binding protein
LNRLLGQRKLAKVSATPGKTRSLNFYLINDRFYLVDLPGYGYAKVPKKVKAGWGKLIENYLTKEKRLIGLVFLMDCRRDPTEEDRQLLDWLAQRRLPALVAVTKADKVNRDQLNRKVRRVEEELNLMAIPFSIKTGLGKNELARAVTDLVTEKK